MTQDIPVVPEPALPDLATLLASTSDPVALRDLHDRAAPLLQAAALRLLRDGEAAGEAVTAVFVQLWRGQARFGAADGEPLGWLLALLRAKVVEIYRRRQREGLAEEEGFREASFADDLARLAHNQAVAGFHAAFTMLDLEHQQILSLAYLDGLSHAELAQRLRMPIGTARAAARAGLERLRHALEMTS
jgi:RNA polymerase sigma-70 factor (ECF subfamily)